MKSIREYIIVAVKKITDEKLIETYNWPGKAK